ncbi:MAG TPA: Dickkopf N-terminal cysteine-rich domain-containing protein, partial [Polyangia bacterium]|nr:Dickkopf N-terminal cysteine-rich domain-containing protein [Polyangia bacterium]
MVCSGGVCAPWLDAGGACIAGAAAIASGCPATQTCTAGACAPVAGKAGPLAKCASDGDCDDGLFCATSGNYCYYVGGINAVCQSDHECAKDLQCLSGACHTPGYIMCATP